MWLLKTFADLVSRLKEKEKIKEETPVAKRNFRKEYDNYHASEKQKRRRALRNKARRKAIREGRARKGDGMDVHHPTGDPGSKSTKVVSKSNNRSFPRTKTARKKKKAS